jgi:predicted O-methyltransferase YrrM
LKYAVLKLPRLSDTEEDYGIHRVRLFRHPVFAWCRLRPVLAQHTAEEHAALKRWAAGRKQLVEIGVAEGVSGLALREVMAEDGSLHLIDPFHLSRIPALNFTERVAHRTVEEAQRGRIAWIKKFSQEAIFTWNTPIDLLLIDGDHAESAVQRDWEDWNRFVAPGGIVIFHDARLFEGGWTTPNYGPVKFVNRTFRTTEVSGWSVVEEIHSLFILRRD